MRKIHSSDQEVKHSRLEATSDVARVLLDLARALLAVEGVLTTQLLELFLAVLL